MGMRYFSRSDMQPGPHGEARSAVAAGGLSLSTTPQFIVIPDSADHLQIFPGKMTGNATIAAITLNPYLTVLRTINALKAWTEACAAAQDGDATTLVSLSAQPTLANGGILLIGSRTPFRGVNVVMSGNVNANASVLTVAYWNGSAWTTLTNGANGYLDGTINAGATFGKSGTIVWPTLPTDWSKMSLREIYAALNVVFPPTQGTQVMDDLHADRRRYWTRFVVSAALSANTAATGILAMNRSTNYAQFYTGATFETRVYKGHGGHGCVEGVCDVGNAVLLVNAYTDIGPNSLF